MKLTCKKCQTVLEVPAEATQAPDVRVVCPGCRTRYRLRPRKAGQSPAGQSPAGKSKTGVASARAGEVEAPSSGTRTTPPSSSFAGPQKAVSPSNAPAASRGPAAAPASSVLPAAPQTASPVANAGWTPATPLPTATRGPSAVPESSVLPETSPAGVPEVSPTVAATGAGFFDQDTVAGSRPSAGVGAAAPAVFHDGETISGRYRILRFLAQGGMGEVYEAEDLELRQKVALKTIRAQAGDADASAVERFKREIALARTVTHPNVCRIFDLGRHIIEAPAGALSPPAVTFLTMELLEGETLTQCLRRRGRLSTAEALPLIQQMAAALEAAHRAQIVHRDFKSENVFLVPDESAPRGGAAVAKRAVVTDFGVARGGAADKFAAQVTGAGIVGTPSYMAPEQVEGGPITAAADIYALGIVIYEMVTGRLPFEGQNPLSTAVKRLNEAPPPPHVHVPDLEAWWEKAILRCLEREPQHRFASVGELIAALEPPVRPSLRPTEAAVPKSAPRPPAASARRSVSPSPATLSAATPVTGPTVAQAAAEPPVRRSLWLGLLLLLVSVVSAGLFFFNRDRELDRSRVAPRRSIAVLSFTNLSGIPDAAWLGTALSEMLTTELARGETLRTVSGENVAQAHQQLASAGQSSGQPNLEGVDLERLRALLGCDFVVSGSYVTLGEASDREIRLDLRLQDAALGNTVASLARDGRQADLFRLVAELGTELREHLGVDPAGGEDPLAGLPSEPEAARLYAEALEQLRASRPRAAREMLQEASRRAPQNALVFSALSQAWEVEGFGDRAAEAAERAFELSSPLPREDRLAVEGRYREATGDWPAAIEAYKKLCDYFPDDLDYGLRLVSAQLAARDPQSALKTLEGLRQLPAPISEDPRIDLAEAAAAGLESDFTRQLESAVRAADRAVAIGSPLQIALARLTESRAQRALGRLTEAEGAATDALDLYVELDHASGSAEALTALANVDFERGDFDAAADRYQQVIEDYRGLGDQDGTASGLNNLAMVLKKRGDLDSAQALYEESAGIFESTGDQLAMSFALNNLGVLLVARDRLAEAGPMFERSRQVWQELGNKSGIAYSLNNSAAVEHLSGQLLASRDLHQQALALRQETGEKAGEATSLMNLADVLRNLGELARAEEMLSQSLALTEAIGDRSAHANALFRLGHLRFDAGALDEARSAWTEALEIRRELDESREVTDSRIVLARLALEVGDVGGAQEISRQAIGDCQRDGRPSEEARATAILAQALLADDLLDEGRDAAEESLLLADGSQQPVIRYAAGIAVARLQAVTGDPEAALTSLASIEQISRDAGYVAWSLEARLALAEVALRAGLETEARQRLRSVATDAGRYGLGRLVDKAGKL